LFFRIEIMMLTNSTIIWIRKKIKADRDWSPGRRKRSCHLALSEEQEDLLASVIRTEFASVRRYCSPRDVPLVALKIALSPETLGIVTLGSQGSAGFRRRRASVEETILEEIDEIAS
jgi:hypothetical protein